MGIVPGFLAHAFSSENAVAKNLGGGSVASSYLVHICSAKLRKHAGQGLKILQSELPQQR